MDIKKIKYKQINSLISQKKFSDAFILMKPILYKIKQHYLISEFEKIKETYSFFLQYKLKGIKDPEQDKIIKEIQKKTFELNDKIKSEYLLKFDDNNKVIQQKRLLEKQKNIYEISPDTEIKNLANSKYEYESPERKNLLNKLFFMLWLTDNLTEKDYASLKKYSLSSKLDIYELSVTVSAVTISLLDNFDIKKLRLLFDFYDTEKQEIRNRALTGIILAMYKYNERTNLYPDLTDRLKLIKNNDKIKKHTENIIIQIIKSKETEKISEKLQNEIIPEMRKFRPKIQDKLNLDDIISEGLIEDFNPDWEEIFDEAPELLDKMADFSRMQLEGSDVFMSAFAQFKNTPFFSRTANWFIPFYSENADIKLDENQNDLDYETFLKGLENSAYICNSDKYSFCFNVKFMPETQRKMIIELFKQENEQMQEIKKDDELLNKNDEDKYIFTRYIQDLYRFYKLHPLKEYFDDIFDSDLDIHNTVLFDILINSDSFKEKIAELYFKKSFYNDAVEILENLHFKDIKKEAKRLEKAGFCRQKNKNFEKALEHYKKAEIINDSSNWLIKKIAFCNRKIQNYDEALEYYLIAEKNEKENLHIQANIGHCYLAKKDYENALKRYFKVEYYDPDNKNVIRPLAWCSLILGKLETAEKYLKKTLKNNPSVFDYINYGNLETIKGNIPDAVKYYAEAFKKTDFKTAEETIKEDLKEINTELKKETDIKSLIDLIKLEILN